MPEPRSLGRPLDQPRDVGEHELAVVEVDRAEHRLDGGERVVGDLRDGPGQPREQRGLAGVRQADEADVGEQLQPQLDPPRLALEPTFRESRCLAGRGGEALVAVAARAPRATTTALAVGEQLGLGAVEAVTTVPGGTATSRSSPRSPCCRLPSPCPTPGAEVPAAPERCEVAALRESQTSTTSPPRPPSPPSGPPRGTCASRRKQTHAVSPAPALDVDASLGRESTGLSVAGYGRLSGLRQTEKRPGSARESRTRFRRARGPAAP